MIDEIRKYAVVDEDQLPASSRALLCRPHLWKITVRTAQVPSDALLGTSRASRGYSRLAVANFHERVLAAGWPAVSVPVERSQDQSFYIIVRILDLHNWVEFYCQHLTIAAEGPFVPMPDWVITAKHVQGVGAGNASEPLTVYDDLLGEVAAIAAGPLRVKFHAANFAEQYTQLCIRSEKYWESYKHVLAANKLWHLIPRFDK